MNNPSQNKPESAPVDRSHWLVRKGRVSDPEMETSLWPTTPEERLAMVWPLTVQAWAFKGVDVSQSRLPRSDLRITRRAG
jgi:hypothetical protein